MKGEEGVAYLSARDGKIIIPRAQADAPTSWFSALQIFSKTNLELKYFAEVLHYGLAIFYR